MYLCVCRRNIRLHTAQKTLLQIGLHESASLSKTTAACLSKVSPQRMDLASDFLGESSGSNQPPACFHATRTLVYFFFSSSSSAPILSLSVFFCGVASATFSDLCLISEAETEYVSSIHRNYSKSCIRFVDCCGVFILGAGDKWLMRVIFMSV